MVTVVLATLLFGGYMLYLYIAKNKKVSIFPVEAGPIVCSNSEDFTSPVIVRVGRLSMDESLTYFIVRNNCMNPRNIYSDDIIGVQMFNDNFTIHDVEEGDILLIYLDDEDFHGHKIRVMKKTVGDAFMTYYYKGNKIEDSSKLHKFTTIRGVVREINHPYKHVA